MKRGYWRTKDGREIPIKELTDKHLLNIKKWIERVAKKLDGAIEFEQDYVPFPWHDFAEHTHFLTESKIKVMLGYDEICEEIKKRGLK